MPPQCTAHIHLLSILHSESSRFSRGAVVRVLDAGCGGGLLIASLLENLSQWNPSLCFEFHGFDVSDHGVQTRGFMEGALAELSRRFPDVPWPDRLSLITTRDTWPYPADFFDIVLSNQVLEHVGNPDLFFSEIRRTLRPGGFSVHLFPLKHYMYETHLNLPFVHRISNRNPLILYIKFLSVLGLGKYRFHRKQAGKTLNDFAAYHADYILKYTHYISRADVLRLAKKHGLTLSFAYTPEFYLTKIRQLLSRPPRYAVRRKKPGTACGFLIRVLQYLSCITIFLEKSADAKTE